MTNQGLGVLGVADGAHSENFDPLMFFANVAIQNAAENTSSQDAGTQDAEMQDADVRDANTQTANFHGAADLVTIKHEEAEGSMAEGSMADGLTRQVITAGELLSMFNDQASAGIGGLSSLRMDSDDEDADDEGDTIVEGASNAKGKGKGKSRSRKKSAVEERTKDVAATLEDMTKQEAEDEQTILEEMRRDAAFNEYAAKNGTGSTSLDEIEATGILPDGAALAASLLNRDLDRDSDGEDLDVPPSKRRRILCKTEDSEGEVARKEFNLFDELLDYPELVMELTKHLRVNDIVSLYAISKDFNETLNGHLSHILKTCAAYQASESSRIFVFTLYASLCIRDPAGRPAPLNGAVVRMVPSLRWLRMVIHREKCVRDILACMAREGHRLPKTMSLSLKKMWLLMDIPTSERRVQLMHNEDYWTDGDLYNLQMFFVKLDMRFCDPIEGPGDDGLRKLILGQRGLTPLWHLLKRTRFRDSLEILEACVRYSYWPRVEHRGFSILGVLPQEVGRGHLEGWGVGRVHLYRPDELVMRESCRRNMGLGDHIHTMMVWGYANAETGENIKVSKEEMYMSSDDDASKRQKKKTNNNKKKGSSMKAAGRETKYDRGEGKELIDDGKEGKDKRLKEDRKRQDGEGDTHMAG